MFLRWKQREHATPIQRGRARCEHDDASSVLWTPVLLHSKRVDGVSRHFQIARLTSIRECCIADGHARGVWWALVSEDLQQLEQRGILGGPDQDPRFKTIVAALHDKVGFERHRPARSARARWAPRKGTRTTESPEVVDPFEVLGVSVRCTEDELKKAWRRAATAHHPDRGGDAESFRRMKDAYEACRTLRAFA